MKNYCGKQIKIDCFGDSKDVVRAYGWNWAAEMFEPGNKALDEKQIQKDYMDMFFGGN